MDTGYEDERPPQWPGPYELPTDEADIELRVTGARILIRGTKAPERLFRLGLPAFLVVSGVVSPLILLVTGERRWLAIVALALCWSGAVLLWRFGPPAN